MVAFVSTLHAIDFFKLANIGALAILLGIAYEVGQATVLFSILMTKNKEKFLPWVLMFLLTALQVTANVYASFKHMSLSGNEDWTYWYTSILKIFGVQGGTPETYQVIISWISGALLPIVALGMTALVAQNIKMMTEEDETPEEDIEPIPASDLIAEVSKVNPTEEELLQAENILSRLKPSEEPTVKKEEVENEVEKIRKIMKSDPIESGAISDDVKKVITPDVSVTVDESEEIDNTDVPIDVPINEVAEDGLPEDREVVPALGEEEVRQMFHDELEGKQPEDEEPLDQIQFKSPGVPVVETDSGLKTNNGLVEIDIETPSPPVEETKVETPEPSPPPVETEEDRLERLRHVARENLKKK